MLNALGRTFTAWAFALHVGVVVVLLVAAVLVSRPSVRAPFVPWIVALCSIVVVGSLLLEVWLNPTALGMAYVLLALLAYGPFTLAPLATPWSGSPRRWRPCSSARRWGGDEFVVLGMGDAQVPEVFSERLRASIIRSGVDSSKWSGSVSVGAITAQTADLDLDELLRLADENMYARRRRRRAVSDDHQTESMSKK